MKKNLSFILILVLIFTGCSKESTTTTPVPTPKTTEELLTEKAWKANEIRVQQANGIMQYYIRGGSSNTVNYDSDSLRFNLNNTGTYYYSGSSYSTTWSFINAEKSKMTLVINYAVPLTLNLENIAISQTYFRYSQYLNAGINSYLASCTRTQN